MCIRDRSNSACSRAARRAERVPTRARSIRRYRGPPASPRPGYYRGAVGWEPIAEGRVADAVRATVRTIIGSLGSPPEAVADRTLFLAYAALSNRLPSH